jgi:hypothetical protein
MYWSPVRLLVWWLNPACSHERYTPKSLLTLHRKGQLAGCSLGYRLYVFVSKPSSGRRLHEAETGSRLTNGYCAMSINSNHNSPWLRSHWFQTVSNCSCWQTSIGQPVLFEYGTGCEWHPSNQTLQCPVVTIRCYPWSAGSWQVFHIVGLCVFSHQSADYSIVVAHLTSNSFEGHPCCMHADYLPSLCFWYSPSYHAYWEWIQEKS